MQKTRGPCVSMASLPNGVPGPGPPAPLQGHWATQQHLAAVVVPTPAAGTAAVEYGLQIILGTFQQTTSSSHRHLLLNKVINILTQRSAIVFSSELNNSGSGSGNSLVPSSSSQQPA